MKPRYLYFLLACLTCVGCAPRNFVLWSPDGRQAVVVAKDVRLCNTEGKLREPLLPGLRVCKDGFSSVCWYPNSRHLCILTETPLSTWADVSKRMTQKQRNLVPSEAPAMLKEILAYKGDWNKFQPKGTYQSDFVCLLIYLRETQAGVIKAKVSKDAWTKYRNLSRSLYQLSKIEVQNQAVKSRRILLETLDKIKSFRLSPDGRWIAFAGGDGVLAVLSPNDGVISVAENTITNPDFSSDGKSIVYSRRAIKESDVPLGVIVRRRLLDDSGNLLKKLGNEEELASAFFNEFSRLRCLNDGRILFSSMEIHLPATNNDLAQGLGLFAIDPRYPTVIRMIPQKVQAEYRPEGLDFFEVSPDQTRVAFLTDHQKVAVLTLATGDIQMVQDKNVDAPAVMIPTWRSNNELCFVVPKGSPDGSKNRPEVVLKSLKTGRTRCISKDWPDNFVEGWLWKKPESATKPAAAPTTPPGQ